MASTSELDELLAPLLGAENIITKPISTLSVMFYIYGVYCVVFGFSIHSLFRHRNITQKLHKVCSVGLFVLATIYVAIYTWGITRQTFIEFHAATTKEYDPFNQFFQGDDKKSAAVGVTWFISTFMNSIADIILIHRCYIVFNRNKIVLYLFALAAVVFNTLDFGYNIAYLAGFGNSAKPININTLAKIQPVDEGATICITIFQIILTLMTGWRIWGITQEARREVAPSKSDSPQSRFNDIIAVFIESAFLYAATLFTGVFVQYLAWDTSVTSVQPLDFAVISTLMSGLVPTMVIARVAYGKSVNSVEQTISTFRIAEAQTSQQRSVAVRQTTVDLPLHSRADNSEEPEVRSIRVVADEKV